MLKKDTSVLCFLCVFGTPFELSQSNLSCVARPKDIEPLAASEDLSPVLSTGLSLILLSCQARPFLSSLCFMGPKAFSWILGFKSFGLTMLFPCGELNLFIITFHGVDQLCYLFGPWCLWFFRPQQRVSFFFKCNAPWSSMELDDLLWVVLVTWTSVCGTWPSTGLDDSHEVMLLIRSGCFVIA